jgi:hypothetical protein
MDKKFIRDAYIRHMLENGKRPVSVYTFCQQIVTTETSFYDSYSSFDALEKDIWKSFFDETLDKLREDEIYRNYSAKEKLLAYYFLWVQQLREKRSYILLQQEKSFAAGPFAGGPFAAGLPLGAGLHAAKLESFRIAFYDYIRNLIKEGYETGEVKERKYISDQYVHGFWLQALFVLRYWIKDDSERFEMTDAAIEKAVHLSFQLIQSNTLDSILDFGKFVFAGRQNFAGR